MFIFQIKQDKSFFKFRLGHNCHLYLLILLVITIPSLAELSQDPNEDQNLFEMSIEELMKVEVSVASKKSESLSEAPGIVSAVSREEFEIYGDRNLSQLMQRQPSVYTLNSFVYGDSVAAFRGDMPTHQERHTLILLNGRPVRESTLGYNFPVYMAFPINSLEGVELIRGPGSVLYGTNAFTGVINLKTRPIPDQNDISVSAMSGSHGYYDTSVSLGGRSHKLGYTADMRVAGQDGWPYYYTDSSGIYNDNKKHDRMSSLAAHLDYSGLTFDIFAADMEIFTMGTLSTWSHPYHQSRIKRLFMNIGYRIPVHEKMTLELNTTYNLQEDVMSTGTRQVGTNTSDVLGEATLFANPTDNMNLVFGYLQEYRRNYKADDDHFQSIPSYDYEPKSAYAQGDYKIGSIAKLIAGTQWNKSPLGDSDIISRYGIILTPHENWGVKLLRGEAFRGPIAVESDLYDSAGMFSFIGNKDLKPETITTYDAQLFYTNKKTNAAVTYFHSRIDGTIVYDIQGTTISYKNGGEQRFNGVEFEAKHFLTPRWHILTSYTHQEDEVDSGINHSQVPSDMGKFGTGYTWKGGSASVFYSYFSSPEPTPSTTTTYNPKPESINLLSLNVRLDVSKWLNCAMNTATLILRAENLLDENTYIPIISSDTYPYGPDRTFYAGLSMKF
jgi:outer membrane receptor protein involved in Fe transport